MFLRLLAAVLATAAVAGGSFAAGIKFARDRTPVPTRGRSRRR